MIKVIAAVASNRVIGNLGEIPWYIPEDLKLFKQKTENNIIIMGRKTFESLGSKPLKNRVNLVISRKPMKEKGFTVINNIYDLIDRAKDSEMEYWVIGGEAIYAWFLPFAKEVHITEVHKSFKGDTYFPKMNKLNLKLISERDSFDVESGLKYTFKEYVNERV